MHSVNITALHWINLLYQHCNTMLLIAIYLSICILSDQIHTLVSEIIVTPSSGHLKQIAKHIFTHHIHIVMKLIPVPHFIYNSSHQCSKE